MEKLARRIGVLFPWITNWAPFLKTRIGAQFSVRARRTGLQFLNPKNNPGSYANTLFKKDIAVKDIDQKQVNLCFCK